MSVYDKVVVTTTGGFTNNGAIVLLVAAGTTNTWDTNGVYNLFQYNGTAPDVTSLTVANPTAGKVYAFAAGGGYVTLTISAVTVTGGVFTWDGGDANGSFWQSATNWVGDTAPTNNSSLQFDGVTRLDTTNDFPANTQFAGITFLGGAGAFALAGNVVNLTGDLINSNINTQAVNLPLVLDGNSRAFNTASGDLAVGGVIDDAASTWGVTKTGPGTLTLTGANTYKGPTTISAGVLQVGNGGSSGSLGSGNVANDSALVFNRAGTLIVSNTIGGAGALTNSGSGTVILGGNSTYAGNTTINAGTVIVQHPNALGGTSVGTTVAGGASLQVQAGGTVAEPLTLSGLGVTNGGAMHSVGANTLAGAITLASAARVNSDSGLLTLSGGVTGSGIGLTVGGTGNATITTAGINTGAGGILTKDGSGTLILGAAGNYSGGTTLSNGLLQVAADASLGASVGALTFAGGNLESTNSYTMSRPVVLNAAATITVDPASVLAVSNSVAGGAGNALIKNGSGTLALSGANTYAGGTTLSTGTLRLASSSALGFGPFVINGGVIQDTSAVTLMTTNAMTWNGSFTADYPLNGDLNLGSGSVVMTTNITVTTGNGWGSLFIVSGNISESGGSRSLTITGAGSPGYVNLRGSNTYSGGTIVNGAGIRIGHNQALGTGILTINSGAIMQTTGGALTGIVGQVWNGNFGFSCTPGSINLGSSPVSLTGVRTISIDNGAVAVGGAISGVGGGVVVQATTYSSSLTLSGSNTFDGGLALVPASNSTFTLSLAHPSALGTGPFTVRGYTGGGVSTTLRIDNSSTGSMTLAANNTQVWSNNLTFVGSHSLDMGSGAVALGTNVTVTVSANTLTLGGILSDAGRGYTLTKAGAGTLVLGGANTYTGDTTIVTGRLSVASGGTLGVGGVHVLGGGTLDIQAGGAIADTATLELATNGSTYGVASLSNGVIEVVGTLILGTNVCTVPATYGSTSSPARFQVAGFFTGTGMVLVNGPHGSVFTFR